MRIARMALRLVAATIVLAGAVRAQSTPGAPRPAAAYVIRDATIVPVTGPRIPGGSVVMQNGRITAVGAGVQAPSGATVIDGTGLFVYPGLINAGTMLGLDEIAMVSGSNDMSEFGTFNPQLNPLVATNAHSALIPLPRFNGITSVITAPTGGLVSGQASFIDLTGWTPEQMAVKRVAALVVNYPNVGATGIRAGRAGGGGPGGGRIASGLGQNGAAQYQQLRDYFARARAYAKAKAGPSSGAPTGTPDLAMEAMIPVLRGEVPVIFDLHSEAQIRSALAFADSFGLKPILRNAPEAWRVAEMLASRKVPVIVGPTYAHALADAPYDEVFANPGILARAGVTIAFQTSNAAESGGPPRASATRDLPFQVALAVGYGLAPDDAIRAVTINAARIFGVDDRLGSIESGKVGNLLVSTGDPLDPRTSIKYLFIRGELVPLEDRHTRLYEEFRARPRPANAIVKLCISRLSSERGAEEVACHPGRGWQ